MKKILFALCAVATLASCSNEEIVNFDKEAIAFDGAFVDNGTRANDDFTIETHELFDFNVWATTKRPSSTEIVPILNEVVVCRPDLNSDWVYPTANTQYWIPDNTYQFVAAKNYKNVELANGVPSKFTYDVSSQRDFLYATDTRVGLASNNAAVAFTFDHLLSKAYFTVKTNDMTGANTNYTYRITNLCINNVVKEATYTVGATTPWVGTENSTYNVEFGTVNWANKLAAKGVYTSDYARLLVPASYTALNITCTIETLYGDSVIDVKDYTKSIAQSFVSGYVYKFVLALGDPGEPIKFTVTPVKDWISAGNTTIPAL